MPDKHCLAVVAMPGLRPTTLGNYLATVGTLRMLARSRWPQLRLCWRDSIPALVGGPRDLSDATAELVRVAANRLWTRYERTWPKKGGEDQLRVWRGQADETDLPLFDAHIVVGQERAGSPILGGGSGRASKRDFSKGWNAAVGALADASAAARRQTEIGALLAGEPTEWLLKDLHAGSWFAEANKRFNFGQEPDCEGLISPWAMALACEGLPFFAGAASRRLGAQARSRGAFPFVCRPAAPLAAGESGRDCGEVWAPIWPRPMSLPEVAALFAGGRAEVGGLPASTPGAFAAATLAHGVDAGIVAFRRFALGRTTSSKTFEGRALGAAQVPGPASAEVPSTATAAAMTRLVALLGQLPPDRKVGKRWRFEGLRGPLEHALTEVAQEQRPESIAALLDATWVTLDRIDRNSRLRKLNVKWKALPPQWLSQIFDGEAPSPEARLALAMVSSFAADEPFTLYRFGVALQPRGSFTHGERAHERWVWRGGNATPANLKNVLCRHALQWSKRAGESCVPDRDGIPAEASHVAAWLTGNIDSALLATWLSRLALLDWTHDPPHLTTSSELGNASAPDGPLALFGLLQPLFGLRPVRIEDGQDLLPKASGARNGSVALALANFLRTHDIDGALRLARARYATAGAALATTQESFTLAEPALLPGSVLFPIRPYQRSTLVREWLRPRRRGNQ